MLNIKDFLKKYKNVTNCNNKSFNENVQFSEELLLQTADQYTRKDLRTLYPNDPWLCNWAINTWEYATGQIELDSYPLDLAMPITDVCNAKCKFCGYCDNSQGKFYDIDILDRYEKPAKYLHRVGFCPRGEPLLHPRFHEFLSRVRQMTDKRCSVYVVTNGVLLEKYIYLLAEQSNSLSISLNAATAETHSNVMEVDSKHFPNIIDSIKNLISIRDKYKKDFLVQSTFVVNSMNLHEAADFVKLANDLGMNKIWFYNLLIAPYSSSQKNHLKKDYEKLASINNPDFKKHYDNFLKALENSRIEITAEPSKWLEQPMLNDKNDTNQGKKPVRCRYVYSNMIDLIPDNKQPLCCLLDKLPGFEFLEFPENVDFFEVWNSTQYKEIRKLLNNGNAPLACRYCNRPEILKK